MSSDQKRPDYAAMVRRARQLRRRMSPIENRVWGFLRNGHVDGVKFRRQHPLGPSVADFYCHVYQLVIEIDGQSHTGQEIYDQERTCWLNTNGYRVIRFNNTDVLKNPNGVREAIRAACRHGHALTRITDVIRPLPEGEVNNAILSRDITDSVHLSLGEAERFDT